MSSLLNPGPLLDLHMTSNFTDSFGNKVCRNLGSLGGNILLGDGVTAATMPTQLAPHGMSFDGTSDYLSIPAPASAYSFGNGAGVDYPFSVEVFLHYTRTFLSSSGLVVKGSVGTTGEWWLGDGGSIIFRLHSYADQTKFIGRYCLLVPKTDRLGQNMVTHWVATYDGSKTSTGCIIYMNALRVDNATSEALPYSGLGALGGAYNIGRMQGIGYNYFQGNLFNHAIYPWALTPSQVSQTYNRRKAMLNRY